jgi:hypothetical protein
MDEVDWVDLPDDNYVDVLGYQTSLVLELDDLIKKYNRIPKDQVSTLSCRIRKLNALISFLQDWITNKLTAIDKKKHLMWIASIAEKKRNYLNALLQIFETKRFEIAAQEKYHFDISDLKDSNKKPVFLQNQRFFSLKMREYWGDFWYEALDPCHRRLTPFLDQWRVNKTLNPDIPDFFLWLETQHVPKYIPRVTYLEGQELDRSRVVIKDGLFWEKSDSEWALAEFADPTKRYLFSINLQEELFAAVEGNGISHSSFTCGKPVLGAGLLQIQNGRLVSIALESGHYMPTTEIGYQILKIFEEHNVLFPTVLEVVFFHDRNKYKAEISPEECKDLETFAEIIYKACSLKTGGCNEPSSVAKGTN